MEHDSADRPGPVSLSVRGVNGGRFEDVRQVAVYQKGVLACVVVQLIAVACQMMLPTAMRLAIGGVAILAGVAGTVFIFLLSSKIHSTVAAVILAVVTLIPIVGFVVMLVVNHHATYSLQLNDIKVGLFGAHLRQFNTK